MACMLVALVVVNFRILSGARQVSGQNQLLIYLQ